MILNPSVGDRVVMRWDVPPLLTALTPPGTVGTVTGFFGLGYDGSPEDQAVFVDWDSGKSCMRHANRLDYLKDRLSEPVFTVSIHRANSTVTSTEMLCLSDAIGKVPRLASVLDAETYHIHLENIDHDTLDITLREE